MGFGLDHEAIHIPVMFILQSSAVLVSSSITTASLMTIVTFVVLMCYGGGFGTMPAFTVITFGPKNVGPIYGLMLTAWSFASAVRSVVHRADARNSRFLCGGPPRYCCVMAIQFCCRL